MSLPRRVFADASFMIAIFNRRDGNHPRAVLWHSELGRGQVEIVTTEAVLWEFLNSLSNTAHRRTAFQTYENFHADPTIKVVGFDQALIEEAARLYGSRMDKSWGISDCFSFVVMKSMDITDSLTADHHFEQAGFTALLLRDPSAPPS